MICPYPFQIFEKNILTNLKIPDTIFKYLKKHTGKSENTGDSLFAHTIFQIFKKHSYESENTWHNVFAHTLFKDLKKTILTNLKIPDTSSKYLK